MVTKNTHEQLNSSIKTIGKTMKEIGKPKEDKPRFFYYLVRLAFLVPTTIVTIIYGWDIAPKTISTWLIAVLIFFIANIFALIKGGE